MSDSSADETAVGAVGAVVSAGVPNQAAWWLTTRRRRPEWQSLAMAGLATFSGRPRHHFQSAQVGDPVLLYLSRPDQAIKAVGVITVTSNDKPTAPEANPQSKSQDPQWEDFWIEVQLAFELPSPLSWHSLLAAPGLAQSEPVKQRSSVTLSRLVPEEYAALQALLIERNPELAGAFASLDAGMVAKEEDEGAYSGAAEPEGARELATTLREQPTAYSTPPTAHALPIVRNLAELQSLTGLPCELLEEARDLLEDTGQIVLYGPPGTGKTWLARGLASLVAGAAGGERVQVVQFHPSTTYEDFIEGLKPRVDEWGRVSYAVMPGVFVRMCVRARLDPDRHYVLLVDEINRAPLARVFGELLYALEYRGPQGAVELSVSAGVGGGETFYVPENLLLVGTMNSADRSLALVDYALRRRFRFIELEPNPGLLDRWLEARGNDARSRRIVLDLFAALNTRLSEALDPDHRTGHTYFMLDPLTPATLDRLWRTALKPLIAEYFLPPAPELEEYGLLFAEAVDELKG